MRAGNGPSVAQALEIQMKKKFLVIGGIATAVALAGGRALAQSGPHGHRGFGPQFIRGEGHDGMGPGMMQHMTRGLGSVMGPDTGPGMGPRRGPGMMRGAAGPMFADPAQIETLKSELESLTE